MEFETYFPVWQKLTPDQQAAVTAGLVRRTVPKGARLYDGSMDCLGLLVLRSGRLRVYILSEDGREITLYRLFERDICLLSASCVMNSLQFEVTIEAETDTELWMIPAGLYKQLMAQSAPLANYTNEIMAARFTDVMWLMEQIMWKSLDKRLAAFLVRESALEGTRTLHTTHEIIGNHLGSPREVVTRMLRYFQSEGWVRLSRGSVEILDEDRLRALGEA